MLDTFIRPSIDLYIKRFQTSSVLMCKAKCLQHIDYVTLPSPLTTPNGFFFPPYSCSCCGQSYPPGSQIRNFHSFSSLTFHIQFALESQTVYLFGVPQSLRSARASGLPIYSRLVFSVCPSPGRITTQGKRGKSGRVIPLRQIVSASFLSTR